MAHVPNAASHPAVWSHSCLVGTKLHYCELHTSQNWGLTDFSVSVEIIFSEGRGDHCIIFISASAENRYGFLDLASIPMLSCASAK